MTVWFTSDLHLWHRAVSHQRLYGHWPEDRSSVTPETVAWHNDLLAQQWDILVQPTDQVWVLGDLTANNKAVPDALHWIRQRPGTKHLIVGNHDPCHPMHRDAHTWQRVYMDAFESVQMAAKRTVKIDGGKAMLRLSHFPYTADEGPESRFMEWRLRNPDEPHYLLHGHTHSKVKFNAEEIHVGVDAWDYGPVALDTITEYIQARADSFARHRKRCSMCGHYEHADRVCSTAITEITMMDGGGRPLDEEIVDFCQCGMR